MRASNGINCLHGGLWERAVAKPQQECGKSGLPPNVDQYRYAPRVRMLQLRPFEQWCFCPCFSLAPHGCRTNSEAFRALLQMRIPILAKRAVCAQKASPRELNHSEEKSTENGDKTPDCNPGQRRWHRYRKPADARLRANGRRWQSSTRRF